MAMSSSAQSQAVLFLVSKNDHHNKGKNKKRALEKYKKKE